MSKGEVAAFVVPARWMLSGAVSGRKATGHVAFLPDSSSESEDEDDGGFPTASVVAAGASGRSARCSGTGRSGTGGSMESVIGSDASPPLQCLVPPPPERCIQVELELELLSMVQVRPRASFSRLFSPR